MTIRRYDRAYDQGYAINPTIRTKLLRIRLLAIAIPVYGCPDDYYDLPLYYGDVYYGNSWYQRPLLLSRLWRTPAVLGAWRLA